MTVRMASHKQNSHCNGQLSQLQPLQWRQMFLWLILLTRVQRGLLLGFFPHYRISKFVTAAKNQDQ